MTETTQPSRRITILREEVARKIAAGEVIDRPFSVVRELLDNSLDAGAGNLEISLKAGGLASVQVLDDGQGMSAEDLQICTHRHATSKIREEEDLYRTRTLGFRGEALAAVAACSRLEIVSLTEGALHANRLRVEGGRTEALEACRGAKGTRVEVNDLFFNLPVRRRFLKSAAAETAACRRILLDKALAFPEAGFRFFTDGRLKFFFPPADLKARICAAFSLEAAHMEIVSGEGEGFQLTLIAARPELARRDRRLLRIYVNRRRIEEYRLIQALEYSYADFMPGGRFPVCFAFLEVEGELVDFNIHPAKKEARFRDPDALRRAIRELLSGYLAAFSGGPRSAAAAPDSAGSSSGAGTGGFFPAQGFRPGSQPPWPGGEENAYVRLPRPRKPQENEAGPPPAGPLYRGQLFRLFLLAEYGQRLFIIDQHAAHERLIYDRLKSRRSSVQELLFPMRFETTAEQAALLEQRREFLTEHLGIGLVRREESVFEILSLPEEMISLEEDVLREALLTEESGLEELAHRLYDLAACRMAVKEGEELDDETAAGLVRAAFTLEQARCPHGRPLWVEISREELLKRVARI